MTYLLLQTFLLLLSAYFAGAMCACLLKRSLMTRSAETAAVAARTSAATYVTPPEDNVPLIKPREIDPVQPRIEVLPRPQRKVLSVSEKVDTTRFERALSGPELNEGMPRKMIVEIRPAVLKPVTGPAQPFKKPEPKIEAAKAEPAKPDAAKAQPIKVDAPKSEPAKPVAATPVVSTKVEPAKTEPAKPEPSKAEAAAAQAAANIQAAQKSATAPADKPKTESAKDIASAPPSGGMMGGIASASAAAAAAVAAAKAAAANVVPRPTPPSPEPPKPVADVKPTEPAKPSVPVTAAVPPPAAKVEPTPAPAKPVESKPAQPQSPPAQSVAVSQRPAAQDAGHALAATGGDDLLRIRAIDAETSRRLNGIGISTFEQIAHWTPADVNRVNQALGLAGRVDREQWIEQAQILAKGGETYYSRNRAAVTKTGPTAPTQPSATAAPPAPAAQSAATAPAAPAKPAVEQPQPAKPAPTPAAATVPAAPQAATAASPAPAAQTQPFNAEPAKPAATPASPAQAAAPSPTATSSAASTLQGKSVAEMATAAAAAIAAASASVTRGIRPIEPISPLARANPNIVMPAKLSDALKDNESKTPAAAPAPAAPQAKAVPGGKADDLKRIRGIGVLIEKRLNALGITTYQQVANWTASDIDRISQTLEFKGRIERESWVEHARILSSGGETEFSRRVDRGDVETSREDD